VIDEATIEKAANLLREAAPGAKVILFGSYARGDATDGSDLDFLVVEPEVRARRKESVRLRDVLRPLRIPVDIIVASEKTFRYWADTPNTVICGAAREGRVFEPVT
jgi:predicted nucleotidyltransferase